MSVDKSLVKAGDKVKVRYGKILETPDWQEVSAVYDVLYIGGREGFGLHWVHLEIIAHQPNTSALEAAVEKACEDLDKAATALREAEKALNEAKSNHHGLSLVGKKGKHNPTGRSITVIDYNSRQDYYELRFTDDLGGGHMGYLRNEFTVE